MIIGENMMKNIRFRVFAIGAKLMIRIPVFYKLGKLFFPSIIKLNVKPLYDYVNSQDGIIKRISDNVERQYKSCSNDISEYESGIFSKSDLRLCSRQYVCLVENGIVRGDTDGVIVDNYLLTDKILFDQKGFNDHPPIRALIEKDIVIIHCKKNAEQTVCEHAISLIKMWSYNYFHFVFEGLSRLGSVEELTEYSSWPIILDACVKDDKRNLDIIDLLNKNKRKIIWLNKGECIKVKKLIVPACMTWATWNIDSAVSNGWGYMISEDAGLYLRNTILSKWRPQKYYNCVFVARGNNNRLVNESSVIELFKDAGFEIFYPDKVEKFQDELDCFSTARCIVLCAGGASTNLVFCRKDVDIYCILPHKYRCDSSNDVTYTVGISVKHINATIEEDGGFLMRSKFCLPVEKCEEIIRYCKKRGYL